MRKEELHILIIGLDRAGKTTLLEKLKTLFTDCPGLEADKVGLVEGFALGSALNSPAPKHSLASNIPPTPQSAPALLQVLPTVGLNIARFEAYGSPLVFWDLGGQAGLRSIWDKYYGESHALLFVVDATDRARLEEAKACLDRTLGALRLPWGAPSVGCAGGCAEGSACPCLGLGCCRAAYCSLVHLAPTPLRPRLPGCRSQPRAVRRAAAGAGQQAGGGGVGGGLRRGGAAGDWQHRGAALQRAGVGSCWAPACSGAFAGAELRLSHGICIG